MITFEYLDITSCNCDINFSALTYLTCWNILFLALSLFSPDISLRALNKVYPLDIDKLFVNISTKKWVFLSAKVIGWNNIDPDLLFEYMKKQTLILNGELC